MKSIKKILLLRLASNEIINASHPRNKVVPFDLKYIEALLKINKNIDVELFDQVAYGYSDSELIDIIHNTKPQITVISFTTLEKYKVQKLIDDCKDVNTLFAGIGQGIGYYNIEYSDWLMQIFDLLIPGEPEVVFVSCINKILGGLKINDLRTEIWNGYLKAGPYLVDDLDSLPLPKYKPQEIDCYGSIYPIKINRRMRWSYVLTSRGCPHSCIFCSPIMRKSYGNKIRYRNIRSVVDEIEKLMLLGANIISFEDDDFTHSSGHVELICREIIKRGLKINWIAHGRIGELSYDLMKIMKESGCILLRFGVESGQETIINKIKKGDGANWRVQTEKTFYQLKMLGIGTDAMFLIGNPEETKEEIEDTIDFAKKLKPDFIQVALLEAYPGSFLFTGLSPEDKVKILNFPRYHYKNIFPNVSNLEERELIRLHKKFYRNFVLRPQYLFSHLSKYSLFYLRNKTTLKALIKGLVNVQFQKRNYYENYTSP